MHLQRDLIETPISLDIGSRVFLECNQKQLQATQTSNDDDSCQVFSCDRERVYLAVAKCTSRRLPSFENSDRDKLVTDKVSDDSTRSK